MISEHINRLQTSLTDIKNALVEKGVETPEKLKVSEVAPLIAGMETFSFTFNIKAPAKYNGYTFTARHTDGTEYTGVMDNGSCIIVVEKPGEYTITNNLDSETFTMNAIKDDAYMLTGEPILKVGRIPADETITSIITTDKTAPKNISIEDLSLNEDYSVVGWVEGTTYYVSTQKTGVKIIIEDGSSLFKSHSKQVWDGGDSPSFTPDGIVQTIDISNMDFSKCKDLSYCFSNNYYLTDIIGLENIDTENVTNMEAMFFYCEKLRNPNIENWKTQNVTNMSQMFSYCFDSDLEISLNLSSWITTSLTNAWAMFEHANLTEINLNNWDISHLNRVQSMFCYCRKLKTIHAEDWTSNSDITYEFMIFFRSTNLVGGISYDENKDGGKYCKRDGGYFSA